MKTEISSDSRRAMAATHSKTTKRMLSEVDSIFLDQLSVALAGSGFPTIREQAAALSSWLSVTPRTAMRWLNREAFPRDWVAVMKAITDHTDFLGGWLMGDPYKTKGERGFLEYVRGLPDTDNDALHRFLFLLRNRSSRVERLFDMVGKGQLSLLQAARAGAAPKRHYQISR